jgi:hypothetical protein
MNQLMGCSDVATSVHSQPHDGLEANHPSCVVDFGIHPLACVVIGKPDLTGRFATCSYKTPGKYGGNHDPIPSDYNLAFFEYQGPGSREANEICVCKYAKVAHGEINAATKRPGITSHEFQSQGPQKFDKYYCGCFGWD